MARDPSMDSLAEIMQDLEVSQLRNRCKIACFPDNVSVAFWFRLKFWILKAIVP